MSEDVTAPTTGDVAEPSDEEVGNLAETCADALVQAGDDGGDAHPDAGGGHAEGNHDKAPW